MYYRVAIQLDPSPRWQQKSTVLSELSTLFQFLRPFRVPMQDQLRVFSSAREAGYAMTPEQAIGSSSHRCWVQNS